MISDNERRIRVARQVRRLIQERQDAENWLRDWEELGEAYSEKYRHQIEKAAGFTPMQFLVRARGWLARDLNRYVGESLKRLKNGRIKNSPFNPVYKVNGGLVDIVHAARQAETPEQMRDLAHSLEKKLPDIMAAADTAQLKLEWYLGVMDNVCDKAGIARPERHQLPDTTPLEIAAAVQAAIDAPEDEIEESAEDDFVVDDLDEEEDDDE